MATSRHYGKMKTFTVVCFEVLSIHGELNIHRQASDLQSREMIDPEHTIATEVKFKRTAQKHLCILYLNKNKQIVMTFKNWHCPLDE